MAKIKIRRLQFKKYGHSYYLVSGYCLRSIMDTLYTAGRNGYGSSAERAIKYADIISKELSNNEAPIIFKAKRDGD